MNRFTYKIHSLLLAGLERASTGRLGREEGQTFVEYAMILALIGVTLVAALTFLRDKIAGFYTQIGNDFTTAVS